MDIYDDDIGIHDLHSIPKYRSLGICKALGVKRERFRDWIKQEYLKPTLPATGQGSKAGFTIGDVYAIALFKKMTETGYQRKLAADIVKHFMGKVGPNPIAMCQYLVCIVKTNPENGEQDIKVGGFLRGDGKDTLDIHLNSKTMTFNIPTDLNVSGWEGMFMFNLIQLRQEVDMALEKLGL